MNKTSSKYVLLFDSFLTAAYLLARLFTSNADRMQNLSVSSVISAIVLFGCTYLAALFLLRGQDSACPAQNIILRNARPAAANSVFTHAKGSDSSIQNALPQSRMLRIWLAHFLILTLLWGICLLTYFPGVGMNDGLNVLAGRLSSANQFPIWYCVYVVILGKIGNLLGSLQYAVVIYSILQILITAAISAGILTFLWIQSHSRVFRYIATAYYLFQPVLAIYSISMLKDTVFSSLLVLYGILIYCLMRNNNASGFHTRRTIAAAFLLASLILSSLRSNGIYIVAVCLVYLFFVGRRFARREQNNHGTHHNNSIQKTVIVTTVCVMALHLSGSAIMNHYNVRHNASETLGIPIQQICAVIVNDGNITEAEAETLSHFIQPEAIRELYQPSSADPVKWSAAFDRQYLNSHVGEFLSLWARLLPENFRIYVKAYLQQTYWFWAPNPDGVIQMFDTIEDYLDNDYLSKFLTQNGIHDAPILSGKPAQLLRNYYQSGAHFLREGVCFWILLFSMVIAKCRKWTFRQMLPCYLPQLLAWLTIMVSTPINNSFRYVLFYAYSMPLYLFFMTHQPDAS